MDISYGFLGILIVGWYIRRVYAVFFGLRFGICILELIVVCDSSLSSSFTADDKLKQTRSFTLGLIILLLYNYQGGF